MLEATPVWAVWGDGAWHCEQGEGVCTDWPLEFVSSTLPVPKFAIGTEVGFKLYGQPFTGVVKGVRKLPIWYDYWGTQWYVPKQQLVYEIVWKEGMILVEEAHLRALSNAPKKE